ncbi:hypothetical protein NEAUS03_2238 [Nematocida ausubeli]|nr:hypothetical protein NEAUS03_2238 [Nematocida ausubeli]
MRRAQVWDKESMMRNAIWTVLLVVAVSLGVYVIIDLLVTWRESQKDALKSAQPTLRRDREERIREPENAKNYVDADSTSDNKESAETEENSTSALDVSQEKEEVCTCGRAADAGAQGVLKDRHLGHSNSTGELAEYAIDKKSHSNPMVEKKEEGMAKNEVEADIEKCKMETGRLMELRNAANLARDAFEEKNREFVDAKREYNEHKDIYITKTKEINHITQEIDNFPDLKPADNTGTEQNEQINKIRDITNEISTLESEKMEIRTSYQDIITLIEEKKKSPHCTRKNRMEYQSLAVKEEEQLLALIKCTLERLKKIHERDDLLYLKAENEKDCLANTGDNSQEKMNSLKVELYENRMKLRIEAIGIMANRIDIQRKVISKTVEREQAYISYDAAESACENQQRVVNEANKAMRAAEEG